MGAEVQLESENVHESIRTGALCGGVAWTVYAIIEFLLGALLTWLIKPSHAYVEWHWGFTGVLFLLYPLIGGVLGGASGLLLRLPSIRSRILGDSSPAIFLKSSAILTVCLAYLLNFVCNRSGAFRLSDLAPVFATIVLIFASGITAISKAWFVRLKAFVNPWAVSFLLLSLPWVIQKVSDNYGFTTKVAVAVAYACSFLGLAVFIDRTVDNVRGRKGISSILKEARAGLLVLFFIEVVLFCTNFGLKQTPLLASVKARISTEDSKRPNVVLIVMDTVRADHLSAYGYPRKTSPSLEVLSQQATLYRRAIAPSDTTLSTHASIFTGLYPRRHSAHMGLKSHPGGRPLDGGFRTLAEILSENGYRTLAVVANIAYLTPSSGLNQGFDYYDYRAPVPLLDHAWFGKFWFIRSGIRSFLSSMSPTYYCDLLYRRAEDINKEVYACIREVKEEKRPFLFFINYMDAHDPYMPPAPFDRMFSSTGQMIFLKEYWQLLWNALKLKDVVPKEKRDQLVSQYDAGIAYIDSHLGALMEYLKQEGLYDNSLIIVLSDHGEAFGERNLVGHGVSVYQDQVHVPMIVKWPNIEQGKVVRNLVSLTDVFATILDEAGIRAPDGLDGKSLAAVQDGEERTVLSESYPEEGLIRLHSRFDRIQRSITWKSHKLIVPTSGKPELYNVDTDPNETEDVLSIEEEIGEKLRVVMEQWIVSSEPRDHKARSPSKLDRETLQRLRSLGYIK